MTEMRWLIKKEMQFFDDSSPAGYKEVRVLQYRNVTFHELHGDIQSEWIDAPEVEEQ